MTDQTPTAPALDLPSPRTLLTATILLSLAFAGSAIFYGASINLNIFAAAVLGMLVVLTMLGPARLGDRMARTPVGSGLAVGALIVLAIVFQYSVSRDSSFVPTWGLALAPMAYLSVRELGPYRERLLTVLTGMVALLATVSVWQLLVEGQRAGLPLTDPNNYGCLLYLVLLPGVHKMLCRAWWGPPVATGWSIFNHLLVLVALTALFATQSRTSAIIVAVALAIWVGLALWQRLSFKPVAILLVLAGIALVTVNLALADVYALDSASVQQGIGVRGALNGAAWQMFLDSPLTGVGIYVFPLLYRFTRDVSDQETAGGFVHNDYLQMLAEGGPLLLACLLAFAGLTLAKAIRTVRAADDRAQFAQAGLVMALGAVLAHAFVNFVFYTPVLSLLIGSLAGMVDWQTPNSGTRKEGEVPEEDEAPKPRGELKALAIVLLGFGWLCWAYLGLDTFSQGVFNRQAGVPFASSFNSDREGMLGYARLAQRLNGSRGMPALAEAVLLEQSLSEAPESVELRAATLTAYRRARLVDPWNPYVGMQMYRFVRNNPAVGGMLESPEQPANLLLQIIALDPTFVPAIDALMQYAKDAGQEELYFNVLHKRVMVWLPWLARMDKDAALRYLADLEDWAGQQRDYVVQNELKGLGERVAGVQSLGQERWFY